MEHEQLQHAVDTRELPYFFTLDRADQLKALEALIFASEEPLTNRMLHRVLVLEDPSQQAPGQQTLPLEGEKEQPTPEIVLPAFDVPKGYFDDLVEEINDELEHTARPYRIVKIAGGFQFATTPQHGQLVQRLLKAKNRKRLTQAALETIAIIAYRQPITKAEIDAIRGVNAGEVVNSLVEKQLVAMVGRAETLGKPLLYGTTEEFLRIFGLNSLSDLPKLREIDDLLKTTTTMIDLDESISVRTDHKTLRKQLALLLEGEGAGSKAADQETDAEATSGAYWHHSMENEAEQGLVEDPEQGTWEADAELYEDQVNEVLGEDNDEEASPDENVDNTPTS
ncbi:MAG TPA: SMC-Scp complex subunit ScpB [Candidatus Didemnitutus sp.]|nr:SMC-Scp complex subunit ScpB [Candidatus Didemnitutus sp.]